MNKQTEISSCPSCGNFFNTTGMNEVCSTCLQKEEQIFDTVSRYLRRRENRSATVDKIVEATEVERDLLYKWVRKGRLHPTLFPNIGALCTRCGELSSAHPICKACREEMQDDLRQFEAAEAFKERVDETVRRTYLSKRK